MTWRISNTSSTDPTASRDLLRGWFAAPLAGRWWFRARGKPRGEPAASPPRRTRRAFTLVELITVMAIMAVLMAMIVGVAPRIQDAWRARLTRTRLQTIVAALQAYAEDYSSKFPYTEDKDGVMAVVDAASLGINLSDVPEDYKKEALLYAALTSARRHGPYYKGAGGQTVVRKGTGDNEFNLFADGWERPIRYEYTTATGLLVRSLGKDGATGGDDIGYFVFQN